jgi:hypothetical protein
MAEPQLIKTQSVQAWLVQPTDDGSQIALVLKAPSGTVAFAFSHDDFALLAAKLLAKAATRSPTGTPPLDSVHTVPLQIDDVSFEPDPDPASTVTMTSQLGKIRLALSIDSNTLLRSFKQFLDRRRASRGNGL